MIDEDNKIKVFGSDDDLKSLGELLSNDTSRKIIKKLMEHQMYTNEIATTLDMRVSLVIHHLKKMETLGLLEIEEKKIKRKGTTHRFFKMNYDIFISFDKNKAEINEKGIFKKFFKEGRKFTTLGLMFMVAYGFIALNAAFTASAEYYVVTANAVPPKSVNNKGTIANNVYNFIISVLITKCISHSIHN